MDRVTADSNIYVSAIQFGGKPAALLDLALAGDVELAISDAILNETLGVLREKFRHTPTQLHDAATYFATCTTRVIPLEELDVVKADPSDDRILECAVAADSDVIVTGDKHLLALRSFRGIKVMTVGDFLQKRVTRGR